jgi:hypothetical protein
MDSCWRGNNGMIEWCRPDSSGKMSRWPKMGWPDRSLKDLAAKEPLQNPSRRSHPLSNEVCGVGFFACGTHNRLQNPLGIPHPGKALSSMRGFAEVP